ncbi:MAG: glycoside hydrolase family 3 C-terminal domain-containing protein, partial [Janthinobacterium lividum]
DERLLTDVLRGRWGFTGTVVADYFAVAFLERLHAVAGSAGDAAAQALAAGIDVELPTGVTYLGPLAEQVRAGHVDQALVDRALRRVLRQKAELGLLAVDYDPAVGVDLERIDLDPPRHHALARTLAEESVVLLSNDATLPLDDVAGWGEPARVCVVGPNADDPSALFGCYSFANHVLPQHPGVELGLDVDSVLAALDVEFGTGARITHVRGADVDTADTSGFEAAVTAAAQAEVCIAVMGDRAGLFGRGTSGEGCDAESLELPGVQRPFVEALLATGTPVVLVLLTGRPYAIDWALERCAAVVQAFFPGQEGAGAIAGVLSGRVNPSGHLPVSLPRSVGAQPYSYLHPKLGAASPVSNIDTAPVRAFGHGLSYTTFQLTDLRLAATEVPTDGSFLASLRVTNTGTRAGAHVVQLYGSDPVASVTRPVVQLLGYARVQLDAGASADVTLDVPTQRLAFSDRRMVRVVEPGAVDLFVGPDCASPVLSAALELTGPVHEVTAADRRVVHVVQVDVTP